jgi:hypothetical protein
VAPAHKEEGIWTESGLRLDGGFARILHLALEFECRTGRSAMDMTIGQLLARSRKMQEIDKLKTLQMANAVATAMSGEEKAWDALTS